MKGENVLNAAVSLKTATHLNLSHQERKATAVHKRKKISSKEPNKCEQIKKLHFRTAR